ncbi:hypothetical protein MK079_02700 [Candidatus Gracilibacteria bacterium]|nr:hypothetical protein [Candidatus Gracilibacteria bacterium]
MTGFGPKEITLSDIGIHTLGSLIAGILGSIVIVFLSFFLSSGINIPQAFDASTQAGIKTSALFPLLLSVIVLLGSTVTIGLTYFIGHMTNPEQYKKNIVIFGQIAFFAALTYIIITPIYILMGLQDYNNILVIALIHMTLVCFGTHIILEILNNYRYVLIGVYGSFLGLFVSLVLTSSIFQAFSSGYAKLVALVLILPVISLAISLIKHLFAFAYYHYFKWSNQDQLGDIFHQIEVEEEEILKEEEEKNSI